MIWKKPQAWGQGKRKRPQSEPLLQTVWATLTRSIEIRIVGLAFNLEKKVSDEKSNDPFQEPYSSKKGASSFHACMDDGKELLETHNGQPSVKRL